MGGDEAPEELPFEAYCKYFAEEIHKLEEGEMMIFDGWNYQIPELRKLVEIVGNPKCLITLNMNKDLLTKMYRKKKELDEAAEITEEDLEAIAKSQQVN